MNEQKMHDAMQKLSQKLEREQRGDHFKKTQRYERETLAGAYYKDNKTMLCSWYFGAIFDGLIDGLQMIPHHDKHQKVGDLFDLQRFMQNDLGLIDTKNEIGFDFGELKQKAKEKQFEIKLNNALYNLKTLIDLLACFDNCKIYNDASKTLTPLILQGTNGVGILLPMRPQH